MRRRIVAGLLIVLGMMPFGAKAGEASAAADRIGGRTFPSVFQAWNNADALRAANGDIKPLASVETADTSLARHDLMFSGFGRLGLRLAGERAYPLLGPVFTPESILAALRYREALLRANPHLLLLAEVHYYSAAADYLPADSPWWLRDGSGQPRSDDPEVRSLRLDFSRPDFQDAVAALCGAIVRTGAFDGCMLDWWHDGDQAPDRLSLIRKIRAAAGEDAILLGNVNGTLPTRTATYMNGIYMEGFGSRFFPDWRKAAANLAWGTRNLRRPAFTALEAWWRGGRGDLSSMRAATALSLIFSDGYVLFADPNALPTPDHLHDWYPFWDKSLGGPAEPAADPEGPVPGGLYRRHFEHGDAVFNPLENGPVKIAFDRPRRSAATNAVARSFTIAPGDGDLFISGQD